MQKLKRKQEKQSAHFKQQLTSQKHSRLANNFRHSFHSPQFIIGFEEKLLLKMFGCQSVSQIGQCETSCLSSWLVVGNKHSKLWYSDAMVTLAFCLRISEVKSSSLSHCSSGSCSTLKLFHCRTSNFFAKCHVNFATLQ